MSSPQTSQVGQHVRVNGHAVAMGPSRGLRMHQPKVLVVLVNYRTGDLAIECLRSLEPEVTALPGARVAVVDNASGDGSAARIAQSIHDHGWQGWAQLLELDRNGGFSRGNNAVLRRAFAAHEPPDYVWLLNPDTRARRGALRTLVRFMEQHPEVGIAGSRLEDPDGTPQRSAFRFHSVMGELGAGLRLGIAAKLLERWTVAPPPPDEACATDWVAGASMMIRREVLQTIGWLDEGFFLYYEEVDFCLRARRAGWRCWYVPSSRIVHFVGQSTGVTDPKRRRLRRPRYWYDSRRRFYVKNYGWPYAVLADGAYVVGLLSRRIRYLIIGRRDEEPARLLVDLVRHSALLHWKEAA